VTRLSDRRYESHSVIGFHVNKLVEDTIKVMLHVKYQSSEPSSFRAEYLK